MTPARLLATSAVFGSWAFSTLAAPLNAEDAAGHIGETATVCGVVASGYCIIADNDGDKASLVFQGKGTAPGRICPLISKPDFLISS